MSSLNLKHKKQRCCFFLADSKVFFHLLKNIFSLVGFQGNLSLLEICLSFPWGLSK